MGKSSSWGILLICSKFGEAWGQVLRPAKLSMDKTQCRSQAVRWNSCEPPLVQWATLTSLCSCPPMVEKDLADTREMRGKIAVVKGHYNTFFEKAQRVADAGASALILINWADGLGEFHRGPDTDPAHVSIPVVCILQCNASQLFDGAYVVCVGPCRQAASTPLPTEDCYHVSGAVSAWEGCWNENFWLRCIELWARSNCGALCLATARPKFRFSRPAGTFFGVYAARWRDALGWIQRHRAAGWEGSDCRWSQLPHTTSGSDPRDSKCRIQYTVWFRLRCSLFGKLHAVLKRENCNTRRPVCWERWVHNIYICDAHESSRSRNLHCQCALADWTLQQRGWGANLVKILKRWSNSHFIKEIHCRADIWEFRPVTTVRRRPFLYFCDWFQTSKVSKRICVGVMSSESLSLIILSTCTNSSNRVFLPQVVLRKRSSWLSRQRCVCVWKRERERVCVCVCSSWLSRRKCVCACVWVLVGVCVCVCVCICVCVCSVHQTLQTSYESLSVSLYVVQVCVHFCACICPSTPGPM